MCMCEVYIKREAEMLAAAVMYSIKMCTILFSLYWKIRWNKTRRGFRGFYWTTYRLLTSSREFARSCPSVEMEEYIIGL